MSVPHLPAGHSSLERFSPPPVVRQVLPNGLVVLIQEDHSQPLVAYHAVVRTGSATEGPYLGTGVSHVLEHMLFKGTARRPVGRIEQEARSYGGTTQGFTTADTTSYQVSVNREFWAEAADLLVDALFHPSLDAQEFLKEREVVLRELKLRADDPGSLVWQRLMAESYRVHPYHLPVIGEEALLVKLTREEAQAYHQSWYHPNATTLAVVGDVQPQAVVDRLAQLTQEIPPGRLPSAALPEEPFVLAPREVAEEAPLSLSAVAIGFPSVSLTDPDLFALDLLSWILGGGRGSRLEKELRERGIVHAVSAAHYTPRDRGLFVILMRMDPPQVSRAVEGALKECARAAEEPFTAQEVGSARLAFLREYLSHRQTVEGQASDLATYETLASDPQFAFRYLEGIETVSPEDLLRVARSFLDPLRATTVKLFPWGTLPSADQLPAGISQENSAQKVVLPNGLRLILKEDHRVPLVTFHVSMLGGVRFETEATNGISSLTARMLLRGTQKRTAAQVIEAIKQMGGSLNSSSGRNALGMTLEVMSEQTQTALSLMAEILLAPSFPSEELEKEKQLSLAEIKAQEEDPFSWGVTRLLSTLFSVHPYRLNPIGDPRAVASLSRKDLIDFYSQVRDPHQMVISVVGDFHSKVLLAALESHFKELSPWARGIPEIPQEPPLENLRERHEETPRKESLVLIGFRGLKVTDPKAPVLDLMEAILSGGAGRLFVEVRERRGLAYTAGASALHGVDPGSFLVYALCDPSKVPQVRSVLFQELRRLAEEEVSPEELAVGRQGLLGAQRISRQTQGALSVEMTAHELLGLGYDFSKRYEARIKEVTPQEIQQVAQEIFDPRRCAVVIGQPGQGKASSEESPILQGERLGSHP